jgi:hypothetical protein
MANSNNNQPIADLNELLDAFKKLNSYETCVQELVVKHFRQAIRTETNLDYLNVYVKYLIEQSLNNMRLIKNESTPTKTSKQEDYNNEVARDLANFLFERDFYYFNSIVQLFSGNIGGDRSSVLVEYALEMLKLNEIDLEKANLIKKKQQIFDRNNLDSNAYVLIEHVDKHIYIHETQFNLLIYLIMIVVGQQLNGSSCGDKRDALFECVRSFKYLNYCQFETALNDLVKHKIMTLDVKSSKRSNMFLFQLLEFNNWRGKGVYHIYRVFFFNFGGMM